MSCEQSLRRYNLKANHNKYRPFEFAIPVVSNHYEDTIWKQITTKCVNNCGVAVLWAIITKIQSESKSQLIVDSVVTLTSCEQSLRRYNLKANHNFILFNLFGSVVVSNHYEDTIWKQITTINSVGKSRYLLWAIITKIQSESKSQQNKFAYVEPVSCEQSLRRYNLKANHNVGWSCIEDRIVVSNHYEDTIWKQITTLFKNKVKKRGLWAIITKIQSESKSQHYLKTK